MANENKAGVVLIPSLLSQKRIKNWLEAALTEHKKFNNYHDKMVAIDIAYARYQTLKTDIDGVVQTNAGGVDAATTTVGAINMAPTTPPVVVSQVDSMVAYLADVFLSGVPLFPVVSNPSNIKEAEDLESILDDHAHIGGYVRQLLLFLKDGVKYNFSCIEVPWTSIDQYTRADEVLDPAGKPKLEKKANKYTKCKRLDPYNVIWDHNVNPGDMAAEGDYAGYVELLSRTKVKRRLTRMGLDNEAFNIKEALDSNPSNVSGEGYNNFVSAPQISDYINARKPLDGMDWFDYLSDKTGSTKKAVSGVANYEWVTIYARIIPSDFVMTTPQPNTVQIWKFTRVNNVLVEARRIISAFDVFPMLFGQPLEDGMGFQTQSVAEGAIPFQEAAKTLINIKFNSHRRAVSDRALYDSSIISSADVNAPVPASKIPVKVNSLGSRTLADAYHQIPFDARGTESTLQDALLIAGFSKDMAGLTPANRGQHQKGNKSVTEFVTTQSNSENILRMPALILEYQVFIPFKAILKHNLFQHGENATVVSQRDASVRVVDIAKLREKVLAFRIADGFTPKSKLASTEAITALMQLILQSDALIQLYGPMVPKMIAHLAQLQGIKGLEQYLPPQPAIAPPQEQAPEGEQPPPEGEQPPTQ